MKLRSLRLRLLLGASVAIFAALFLAWMAMLLLFSRHIERRAADEMTHDAVELIVGLSLSRSGAPLAARLPSDERYELPSSGRYWQLSTPSGSIHSRSLWDEDLPTTTLAESAQWTARKAAGPFGQRVFLLERRVRPSPSGPAVLVQLALDERELLVARSEFGRELALFLGILWAMLLLAAWLQIRLGLRPLQQVRSELAALQRNPSERLRSAYPSEIRPLTDAINQLAEAREKDLTRARRRAADLAHSLKTPLAALSAQSRRARATGAVEAAENLDRVIAAAAAAVEAELARSRAAALRDTERAASSSPLQVAERIVSVIERTELGAHLVFEVEVEPTLRIGIADDDLMEMLGALVENASRFARRRVRLSGGGDEAAGIVLCIEDDGPGLDISAETALLRGGRLDEAGHGHHGLGLSIARELVEASGGGIALTRSGLGGLQVTLRWPAMRHGGP